MLARRFPVSKLLVGGTLLAVTIVATFASISFIQFQNASVRASVALAESTVVAGSLEAADRKLGSANGMLRVRSAKVIEEAAAVAETRFACGYEPLFCAFIALHEDELAEAKTLHGEAIVVQDKAERVFAQALEADSSARQALNDTMREAGSAATTLNATLIVGGSLAAFMLAATLIAFIRRRRVR